jgi:DegV family protein with EDD domain
MIAAEEYRNRVYLVDSEIVSVGERILVDYAVSLRDAGLDAAEIASVLEEKKKSVCVVALLDTLEYLKKGGRISAAAAFAGGLLSIKPVVSIEDGEVVILGKARGSKQGSNMLMQMIEKKNGIDFKMPVMLGYTGLSDALLQKYISDSESIWKNNVDALPISTIGGTIGTHAGPGAIAVAFFHK